MTALVARHDIGGDELVRRVSGLIAIVLASTGLAPMAHADEGEDCATVLEVPEDQLPRIISACSHVADFTLYYDSRMRALRYLGQAYLRQKNYANARRYLDQALALAPQDEPSLKSRAELFAAQNDRPHACSDYQQLNQLKPRETRWRVEIDNFCDPAPVQTAEPAPSPEPAKPSQQPSVPYDQLVRRLQAALRTLGQKNVAINGDLDLPSQIAMDRMAPEIGLAPGASVDDATVAAFEKAANERRPAMDAAQKDLNRKAQTELKRLGYDIGTVDGAIGPRSQQALKDWFAQHRESWSGTIDEALVARLQASSPVKPTVVALAPVPPPATPDKRGKSADAPPPQLEAEEPQVAPPRQPIASPAPAGPPVAAVAVAAAAPDVGKPKPPALPVSPPAVSEKRVALVIGNASYLNAPRLKNPRNDAKDMAAMLKTLGFEVTEGYDLGRDDMNDKTSEFARKAENADLALVYYSGHGVQIDGENYLIPIDARLNDRYDLRNQFRLNQLTEDGSNAKKAILVIDACRDNPLVAVAARGLRGDTGASRAAPSGLAQPSYQPRGTLIAYATRPGTVALDGDGRNSPYVAALLKRIATPDIDVRRMLDLVADDVAQQTQNQQVPTVINALGGEDVVLVAALPRPTALPLADLSAGERWAVQRSLQWLGYWDGPVDGSFSTGLDDTVRRFQRDRGGKADGRLGPSELLALYRSAERQRPAGSLPQTDFSTVSVRASTTPDAQWKRQQAMFFDPAFVYGGVAKDEDIAITLYRQAASQGDMAAAARLGLILARDGRSDADRQEAMKWLDKAAKAGEPVAALRLAELLAQGPRTVELLQVALKGPDSIGPASARLRELGVAVQ